MVSGEIPSENDLALLQLAEEFRETMKSDLANAEGEFEHARVYSEYLDSVFAASEELGIDVFDGQPLPFDQAGILENFYTYSRYVDRYITRVRVRTLRRRSVYSVPLSSEEKTKIRHLIGQIKNVLDGSNISIEKKDSIHVIIASLLEEVERDRTGLDVFADKASRLARISGDFAREGVEPWWKFLRPIFEIFGAAKEREEQAPRLPPPDPPKRIEGPRRRIASPSTLEDDIPF